MVTQMVPEYNPQDKSFQHVLGTHVELRRPVGISSVNWNKSQMISLSSTGHTYNIVLVENILEVLGLYSNFFLTWNNAIG